MANGYKHLSVIQSRGEAGSEHAAEPGPSIFGGPMPLMAGIVSVPRRSTSTPGRKGRPIGDVRYPRYTDDDRAIVLKSETIFHRRLAGIVFLPYRCH